MRLHKDYLVHESENEVILVATGESADRFCGILKGNQTLKLILEYLETETTVEEIVADLSSKYEVERDVVKKDVEEVLRHLEEIGALLHE